MRGVLLHSMSKGQPFELIDELDVRDETPSAQIVAVVTGKLTAPRGIRRSLAATPRFAADVKVTCIGLPMDAALEAIRAKGYSLDRWGGLWVVKPSGSRSLSGAGSADASVDPTGDGLKLMRCAA